MPGLISSKAYGSFGLWRGVDRGEGDVDSAAAAEGSETALRLDETQVRTRKESPRRD